ncbi:MAG TPA: cellulase family glycosylhydrolase [Acidobacteriaceae bacterium]|nr:cellulase family glycosylhydrolase [Acidobacteriaceae bacterium]
MRTILRFLVPVLVVWAPAASWAKTIVFWQPGFPTADSVAPDSADLRAAFAGAEFADASQLGAALAAPDADLLVLPYGSAWPEQDWTAILEYLDRGGNLMVLGGKAFTRAGYQDGSGWHLRPASVAETLELFIDGYQQTPGSDTTTFTANRDVFPALPAFAWKRAFSPVVRLSVVNYDSSGGATGGEDMDLTTLAWGVGGGHKLAAPVLELDHNANRFVGGRWILVACEPDAGFFGNTALLKTLAMLAVRKGDRFTFRPRLPLYVAGEPAEFRYEANNADADRGTGFHDYPELHVRIVAGDGQVTFDGRMAAIPDMTVHIAGADKGPGFHTVEATLLRDGKPLRRYWSGFWMRDWDYLMSGPKLSVGHDYFELNGKPLPVVGTTYMASDVDRLYLLKPNAYVWDHDMAQIHGAGLNMIRTGLWTTWKPLLNANGQMSEEGLRAVEAFLMCARQNDLTVQFNLFAFYPDTWGGVNGYLDPAAVQAESIYVQSLVERFHSVPFLAWDLVNEPSANSNLWKTLPDYDPYEEAAWKEWIADRYSDRAKLLQDWAEPSLGIGRAEQSDPTATPPEIESEDPWGLPPAEAFDGDAVRSGFDPLKDYDYTLFTQWVFTSWMKEIEAVIRGTGSQQLVAVGQDEGGVAGRLSPAFFSPLVDFTNDHTWWDYDAILWASLAPKMPGKPMLIQETGEQRRLTLDGHLRFSAESEALQLQRKIAIAFAQGAGALEWVWNVNACMANDNEVPIGAVRPDGTWKPEAQVLAGYAAFVNRSPQSFTQIVPPPVTMVTSQTMQYSVLGGLALDTQKHALRAMAYVDHMPLRMLPENRVAELCADACPKLVFLPSPQGLTDAAWQELMDYVARGGTLLVTGPVDRDEHWQPVDRSSPLGVREAVFPLAVRQSELTLPDGKTYALSFPAGVQQSATWTSRFGDGKSVEVMAHGSGRILWTADPVEFSEGYAATAALYRWALSEAGVKPVFREVKPLSEGVLAYPTVLTDGEIYSFSNESLNPERVNIVDALTDAHIDFTMPAQAGAALLLNRDGKVLSSYGGAKVEAK